MKVYKTMESGVILAEYEDSMAQAVADMWNKSRDSWGGGNEIETAESVRTTHSSGSFFNVFIALYNGEAVGYCSFDRFFKDANTAYVHVLNVRPDFHGHKVGKELVMLCVEKTIELGYPRVDIHTWPGNTKAVPLYKKCGFLWEDRADTTHLSNFIPTVLKTELFADFFKETNWYSDSSRVIEVKPDGVKVNKFEVYGYSWEKNGAHLAVGFEKTGRRIRLVETDDYRIELMAENHELAFGPSYKCEFTVENKTGKELNIKISGKSDGLISFDYDKEASVTGIEMFEGEFRVGEIAEELDPARMHPCVLADVWVNGKRAEFGLGIEPKFPLTVKLNERRGPARPGISCDAYINIKSALSQKATVKVNLPCGGLTRFTGELTAELEPRGSATIPVKAEILACGWEKLDASYEITLEDKTAIRFERPLHILNHGLEGMYAYETDDERGAVNGQWRVGINRRNNRTCFRGVIGEGSADFNVSKLGKPYDDEFDLLKPSDVRVCGRETAMVIEADFESGKFPGAVVTEISELLASGAISRCVKVKNASDKSLPLHLMTTLFTSVGRRAVFHYDGGIHEVRDDLSYGFSGVNHEKIDENWIFDSTDNCKAGIMWPPEYRPQTKWGDGLVFEHDMGALKPGQTFETKPITYMCGVFGNFRDFRNYALGVYEEVTPRTNGFVEVSANSGNPFAGAPEAALTVKNNRLSALEGDIRVSSPDGLFEAKSQSNPNELVPKNAFALPLNPVSPGIYLAETDLRFQGFEKKVERALFVPGKGEVATSENNGVYAASNGVISFSASPAYSDALYSLKYGENEWLYSKYPVVEPYAWWNPFIGGVQATLPSMSNSLVRREKMSAGFASVSDNFGTKWSGIMTRVDVSEFDEHKGMSNEQYFLTLPSLPVLCYFVKLVNNTGEYKRFTLNWNAFVSGKEGIADVYAQVTGRDRQEYRIRMGAEDSGNSADKLVRVSREGASARPEKLYAFTGARRANGGLSIGYDVNFAGVFGSHKAAIANKGVCSTLPVFLILTEKELGADALSELDNITFNP